MSVVPQIKGHPTGVAMNTQGQELRITLCSECGELRSILWLTGDRWYCRSCRSEGAGNSKVIPINNPARRR